MSRKKPTAKSEFVFFNVLYEDGSQTSNRKVPGEALAGFGGDKAALAVIEADKTALELIEAQDREIAERSGRPRPPIKSVTRVKGK
jgi:hypothetical protein